MSYYMQSSYYAHTTYSHAYVLCSTFYHLSRLKTTCSKVMHSHPVLILILILIVDVLYTYMYTQVSVTKYSFDSDIYIYFKFCSRVYNININAPERTTTSLHSTGMYIELHVISSLEILIPNIRIIRIICTCACIIVI